MIGMTIKPCEVSIAGLQSVAFESDSTRVTVPPVDLDGYARVSPQQIDLPAVDANVRLVSGHAGPADQAQHCALTVRARALGTSLKTHHVSQVRETPFPLIARHLMG